LSGKTAIVTGAGRGIGRAISLAFCAEGAKVVVASRTIQELDETARMIRRLGGTTHVVRTDVSVDSDVRRLIQSSLDVFGRIDVLVNDAGILGPIARLDQTDTEKWIETVHVNLIGSYLCCKAVIPHMIQNGGGKIINISGGGSTSPWPFFSAYSASKTGIVRLTETLAEEVKGFNIDVNVIAPGGVDSRLQDEIINAPALAGTRERELAIQRKKGKATPVEKAADLAVFLASNESDKLSGRIISAEWDKWRDIPATIPQIMASDVYTLRRIIPKGELGRTLNVEDH
jgi:3-oxoacyl-[acyl-carrier protein] reductase